MPHKPFPNFVEISVLMRCKRRCALCFGLNDDHTEKRGQLAHIDRNGENIAESNAAWLCSLHHDLYDSISHQTKGYTPGELKGYLDSLLAFVTTIKNEHKDEGAVRQIGRVALDVYDRRVPIYRAARQFVRDVSANLEPGLQLILKFAADTDEARFLFDDGLAEYLETLFKKALRLHTIGLLRERMRIHPEEAENFQTIVKEETDLAMWFTKQPEEIRDRFAPFLRLGHEGK
jgi:hypothetical protein